MSQRDSCDAASRRLQSRQASPESQHPQVSLWATGPQPHRASPFCVLLLFLANLCVFLDLGGGSGSVPVDGLLHQATVHSNSQETDGPATFATGKTALSRTLPPMFTSHKTPFWCVPGSPS